MLEAKFDQSRARLAATIELIQKHKEVNELEETQRINELKANQQRLVLIIIALLLLATVVFLMMRLKRKEQLQQTAMQNQALHSDQLNSMLVNQDTIKNLFKGIEGNYVCFDSTGNMLHQAPSFVAVTATEEVEDKIQHQFPELWSQLLPHLDQDEQLSADVVVNINSAQADQVWVHQMPYLDNLLVALFIDTNQPASTGFKDAERIKKYTEFKQQLTTLIHNTKDLVIHQVTSLTGVLQSIKIYNQAESTVENSFSTETLKVQLVDLMNTCLEIWQQSTQSTPLELAEQSGLWLISVEEGHLRTRTMNRYTSLQKIPDNPRWQQVIKTAHFILSNCQLNLHDRQELNQKTEKIKQLMRSRALSN